MAENNFSALSKIFTQLGGTELGSIRQALIFDAAQRFNQLSPAIPVAYAIGTFTVPDGSGLLIVNHLILTGNQRLTLKGNSTLRIV